MTCESIDWNMVKADERVLWFRTHRKRSHWRAHGIGEESLLRSMAKDMVVAHPKRSFVILPKGVSPAKE